MFGKRVKFLFAHQVNTLETYVVQCVVLALPMHPASMYAMLYNAMLWNAVVCWLGAALGYANPYRQASV